VLQLLDILATTRGVVAFVVHYCHDYLGCNNILNLLQMLNGYYNDESMMVAMASYYYNDVLGKQKYFGVFPFVPTSSNDDPMDEISSCYCHGYIYVVKH
jgi:hypothetical protein